MVLNAPYTLQEGHIVFEADGKKVLLDTGSPVSLGNCGVIKVDGTSFDLRDRLPTLSWEDLRMLIGLDVDVLLGMDVIGKFDLTIDPDNDLVVLDRKVHKENIHCVKTKLIAGIPVIDAEIGFRQVKMFFDTGARLSYIGYGHTWAGKPLGWEIDFHPSVGRFETRMFLTGVEIAGYETYLKTGILPGSLKTMVNECGIDGILGTALLEHYTITLSTRRGRLRLAPRVASGNSFISLVLQAARNHWCVKYMCTTCCASDYRSALKDIPDLAGAMARVDPEELVRIRDWDGALRVAYFDLKTACEREQMLKAWLDYADCPVSFADVVLYYLIGGDLVARFNEDLRKGWVDKCVALAINSRDCSLTESLVWILGRGVEKRPGLLDLALKHQDYRKMRKALSQAGFLPTVEEMERQKRGQTAAEKATNNLFGAIRRRDVKAVTALFKKGADLTARDSDGKSIIEPAQECGNEEIKELIGGRESAEQ